MKLFKYTWWGDGNSYNLKYIANRQLGSRLGVAGSLGDHPHGERLEVYSNSTVGI